MCVVGPNLDYEYQPDNSMSDTDVSNRNKRIQRGNVVEYFQVSPQQSVDSIQWTGKTYKIAVEGNGVKVLASQIG